MKRLVAGLLLAVLALAGCGDDAVVTPTPLPPSPPPPGPLPPPQPDPDAIPVGFGGVLPAPGTALTLHPGTEFLIPVMADADLSDYVRRSGWTGIPVGVVTDAPADVLSVSGEVSAQGWEDPALLAIRVLESVEPAGFDETYEIHLEPPAGGFSRTVRAVLPAGSGARPGPDHGPGAGRGGLRRSLPRGHRGPFAAATGVWPANPGSRTSGATTGPPT